MINVNESEDNTNARNADKVKKANADVGFNVSLFIKSESEPRVLLRECIRDVLLW